MGFPHTTKQEWKKLEFGMKVCACVDDHSSLVYTVTAMSANAHDKTQVHNLLNSEE